MAIAERFILQQQDPTRDLQKKMHLANDMQDLMKARGKPEFWEVIDYITQPEKVTTEKERVHIPPVTAPEIPRLLNDKKPQVRENLVFEMMNPMPRAITETTEDAWQQRERNPELYQVGIATLVEKGVIVDSNQRSQVSDREDFYRTFGHATATDLVLNAAARPSPPFLNLSRNLEGYEAVFLGEEAVRNDPERVGRWFGDVTWVRQNRQQKPTYTENWLAQFDKSAPPTVASAKVNPT